MIDTSGKVFEYVDWGELDDEYAFAVVVVGEAMSPTVHAGDYLVFTTKRRPVNGHVVFVRFISGRCVIARYHEHDQQLWLTRDNPQFPPIQCQRRDLESIAVALEKRTRRI